MFQGYIAVLSGEQWVKWSLRTYGVIVFRRYTTPVVNDFEAYNTVFFETNLCGHSV